MDDIDILLATCNGKAFLDQQIGSILEQSHRRWKLLIGDDCSSDGCCEAAGDWAARYPERLRLLKGDSRLGPGGRFGQLAALSEADYVAFCDQDDIWDRDKLVLQLAEMKRLEARWGKEVPLLVHSDLQVIDADGRLVDRSFWHYRRLDPARGSTLNRLVTQNVVTGCTVLANRPLLDLGLPIPPAAIMHDWWLALTAAAFGMISGLPQATVRYRQHPGNLVGARTSWDLLKERLAPGGTAVMRHDLARTRQQAGTFAERHAGRLSDRQREILGAYVTLGEIPFFARMIKICKYGMFKNGFLRTCAMLAMG